MEPDMNSTVMHLADGNPGAAIVLFNLANWPGAGLLYFHWMGEHNLKGPAVWTLYKYICKQDIIEMMRKLDDYTTGKGIPAEDMEIFKRHRCEVRNPEIKNVESRDTN